MTSQGKGLQFPVTKWGGEMAQRRVRLCCVIAFLVLATQLGLFTAPVQAAPSVVDPVVHTVRWGESVALIALRYGTTVNAIVSANSLRNPNFVYAGQRLVIPSGPSASATSTYVVQRGDWLSTIAARHGTTVSYLASLNGLRNPNFIWVGQRLKVPSSSAAMVIHVVQRGEILARIAQRHGTTASAIAAANNLTNPSFIYTGQRLIIPVGAVPPPTSAPTPHPSDTGSVSPDERWIDVNLSTQRLLALEGSSVVYSALVSTGTARYPTPTGTFRIQRKYWYDDMTGGSRAAGDYYYLPDVPHAQYFYAGYSLHGTYWHNNFGTRMSHGCINLSQTDAAWLFNWTSIGTKVVIHY